MVWQGDYRDKKGKRFIILKALRIIACRYGTFFCDLPGSNIDLNVLDQLPVIHEMFISKACDMTFEVNGQEYNQYYLLADDIYV